MRAPLSWLRDFAPFDLPAEQLARVFDDLGMVVESVEHVGQGLGGVVLGRVLDVRPIEGARVRVTRVDLGDTHGRDVQIVCGAANVAPGQLVPVAVVGAVLPGGFEIGTRTVRGVESHGMICSEVELGLGQDAAGIMVLADGLGEPGQPFGPALGIEPDVVFDLAIETNRPDANCVAGVARDAAARLGLPFRLPDPPPVDGLPAPDRLPEVACWPEAPRFSVTVLEGARVGPSPAWMARRLALAGMRPISNLVDISNYVMLELGQPTHPYDLERLPGGTLGVRHAEVGEVVVTLDEVERRLGLGPSPDVVITDGAGTPVGIAGVMGGASSEISGSTSTVLLEAAHFDRLTIAKTSKRLGLRSEASARFERGVDPLGIELAAARFAELAGRLAGTRPVAFGMAESADEVPVRPTIRVRTARVNGLLGTDLADEDVERLLAPIGFRVQPLGPGECDVTPPSFRLDSEQEVDVIEEVARHLGYSHITRTTPRSPFVGMLSPHQRHRRAVREVLAGAGLDEAATGLLVGPGDHARAGLGELEADVLVARDPLAREESVLRRSLRPGLLRAAGYNLARRLERVWIFEIGTVFHPSGGGRPVTRVEAERWLPDEPEVLSVLLAGVGADARAAVRVWRTLEQALRVDGVVLRPAADPGLHPTRTAALLGGDGTRVGTVGEVDPDVAAAWDVTAPAGWLELDLRLLLAQPRRPDEARPVSRFPSSDLDLAFVVPDAVAVDEVLATLRGAGGDLLEWARLFDTYRGPALPAGTRSLAFRLRLVAQDRTLDDAELGELRRAAIAAVEAAHGATLR